MVVRRYDCEFNWNGDGTTFVEESGRLLSFSTRVGRSTEVSRIEASTCQVILKNDDGRYTPKLTSGPLFGDLLQERRFRLKGWEDAGGSVKADLFFGFITKIAPDIHAKTVAINLMDWSLFMRTPGFNLGPFENKRTDELITEILDAVSFPSGGSWRAINVGQTIIETSFWRNTTAWDALQEIADSELGGIFYFDGAGKAVFEDRHKRPLKTTADLTFTNTLSDLDYSEGDDIVFNRAKLQAGGYFSGVVASQIWSHIPLPFFMGPGQTLADVEISDDADFFGPAKDIITPVITTDFAATDNQDGTGANRNADLSTLSFDSFGNAAVWDQQNIGVTGLWVQRRQIRGTPTSLPSHARTIVRSGPKLGFLDKEYQRSYRLIADLILLGAYAEFIVLHYSSGQPGLKVSLEPEDEALKTKMFQARLSDLWKITDTAQPYQTQVDQHFNLELIEHDINVERGLHQTRVVLSTWLAKGTDDFWILGTSELGTDTGLGF